MSDLNETLSSNSLFRFTEKPEYLTSILKNGIAPRYYLENFGMFDLQVSEDLELAVPMSCFCDIPLSKVKRHLSLYGSYGIALSKKWGISNGVSPLMYIDSNSETTKSIQDAIYYFLNRESPINTYRKLTDLIKIAETETNSDIIKNIQAEINDLTNNDSSNIAFSTTYQKLLRLVRFTKPYQGKFWRNGEYKDIRFYDEREWRYIPPFDVDEYFLKAWIPKDEFLDEINRASMNETLAQKYSLKFKPDDVRYIIIAENNGIVSMVNYIEKELKDKYSKDDISKVITKIITKEQIEEDF